MSLLYFFFSICNLLFGKLCFEHVLRHITNYKDSEPIIPSLIMVTLQLKQVNNVTTVKITAVCTHFNYSLVLKHNNCC